jgi:hypothetical protein
MYIRRVVVSLIAAFMAAGALAAGANTTGSGVFHDMYNNAGSSTSSLDAKTGTNVFHDM